MHISDWESKLIFIYAHVSRSAQPLCIGTLVTYFSQTADTPDDERIPRNDAYLNAFGIVFCSFFCVVLSQPFILYGMQLGMRIRQSSCSLIYRKVFAIAKIAETNADNNTLWLFADNEINQISEHRWFEWGGTQLDDWRRVEIRLRIGLRTWLVERSSGNYSFRLFFVQRNRLLWLHWHRIHIVIHTTTKYEILSSYNGHWLLAIIFIYCKLAAYITKMTASYRLKNAERTGKRIRVMNEVIQGIQIIKMYAWEHSFANVVDIIRK